MPDLDQLLNARGHTAELGAHVIAACFSAAGSHAAFALGDGTVRITDTDSWSSIPAHAGAVLSLAAHPVTSGFCSGGDDGKLLSIGFDGTISEIGGFGSKWVEHIACFAGKTPLIAAAAGKNLHLFTGAGEKLRVLEHPSTVTGVAFDTKGKRVAASHYNGASLWFTASTGGAPRKLEWKGSHLGVAIHPNGEALVTGMQENALHGWTLPEGKHMRMAGYPAKPESFGFTKSGRWLATGGADVVVLWPFFGGGPMGKAPKELGPGDGGIVKRLACHPQHEVLAAGFDTGMLIVVDIQKEQILPVCGPGRGAVTALGWNASGSHLAFGTESGFAAVVDFSAV
ncbi:MAG TPA: WD40 repeat domain-containing protein [Acidocella sp.]|nr:WD40 repeat domain-containing protein [Acidocella sp.]